MDRILVRKPFIAVQTYDFSMKEYYDWIDDFDYDSLLVDFDDLVKDEMVNSIKSQLQSYSVEDIIEALYDAELIIRVEEEEFNLGEDLWEFVNDLTWGEGNYEYEESYGDTIYTANNGEDW